MAPILRPIDIATARKLRRGMKGADVLLLHALLNHHLGPPDDQLPVEGPGAEDFGSRTEQKVKRFQEINRIDIGTPYFKDGVVGKHTWAVLNEAQQVTLNVIANPNLKLNPPAFPGPRTPPTPLPNLLPVPKLTLDDNLGFALQLQAGEQGMFPVRGGGVTVSHSLQLVAIMLKKKDQDSFHPELQLGPTVLFNRGPGADSKTDLGFLAILNLANMPGSGGRFNWSIQAQLALIKSLSNRGGSGQLSLLGAANLNIRKDGSLQATTQRGPVLEADPPTSDNGNKWGVKAGLGAFFGLTGTINLF